MNTRFQVWGRAKDIQKSGDEGCVVLSDAIRYDGPAASASQFTNNFERLECGRVTVLTGFRITRTSNLHNSISFFGELTGQVEPRLLEEQHVVTCLPAPSTLILIDENDKDWSACHGGGLK